MRCQRITREEERAVKSLEELTNMSDIELSSQLQQLKEQLFKARMTHAQTPLKNPLRMRTLRRQIARVGTLLKARQQAG